jgi:hypothetical protein
MQTRQTKAEIEAFVKDWIAQNVRSVKGSVPTEVDRLAAELTGAARAEGISGGELNRALGDIDDYLTEQYQQLGVAAAS